jgi:outer membrane protein assembly factor BamB
MTEQDHCQRLVRRCCGVWPVWIPVAAVALGWAYQSALPRVESISSPATSSSPARSRNSELPRGNFQAGVGEPGRPTIIQTGGTVATTVNGPFPLLSPNGTGFRGANRDGTIRGVTISTEWESHAPQLVWKLPVGAAWSSMALHEGRLYTQEQRGEFEAVVCRDASAGEELWTHQNPGRFSEARSGVGPRATPEISGAYLVTLGATGRLNCLDATTGALHWSRDIIVDAGGSVPEWGVTNSPLVIDGHVIVYAGNDGTKDLLAYRIDSGAPAWTASAGKSSYVSVQPAMLGGVRQVLMLADHGLTAVDGATGSVLWEFPLDPPGSPRTVQPHVVGDSHVLIASETDFGVALLEVVRESGRWVARKRWESPELRPQFNDFVVHAGHLYGFDGVIFCCIDLQTGRRAWKGGRYGHGQVVLLADQQLLLVLSESGEAVLVSADPRGHEERGRFQALQGKTWNHPVVVSGRLFVRNAEEMACYALPDR